MTSSPITPAPAPAPPPPPPPPPTPADGHPRRRWLVAIACGGLLTLSTVALTTINATSDESTASPDTGDVLPPGSLDRSGLSGAGSSQTAGLDVTTATEDQAAGVVIVETVNGYSRSASAGTGIVLTADGLVLTNNHVIEGATQVQVSDPSTGEVYAATVVGADPTSDIAVLELDGADDLTVADLDDDDDPQVGDEVTGVGNAYGGGELVAAPGTVTALDQGVTTQASYGSQGETLTGMIEVDADIVSGDSGGPLLDDDGEVVGVNTAASEGGLVPASGQSPMTTNDEITAYAIPIDDALEVAEAIMAGEDTGGSTTGNSAFLGVQLAGSDEAVVSGVVGGTPAEATGLQPGDTIIGVDGTRIRSAGDLSAVLDGYGPGDRIELTWIDGVGQAHQATVTLATGPAA